jgi:lysophospholipase L1-like esterase
VTLAPAEDVWSDPVSFDVKAFQRLAVSLDVASASDVSMHTLGLVTNYSARGARAAESSAQGFSPMPRTAPGSTVVEFPIYWIAAVDALSSSAAGTIVAVGDSWIDGRCSTTENKVDLYQRWIDRREPDHSRRRQRSGDLDRLDRDVLERAGATHVLYLQGMNDIGGGAGAEQVTAAMQQVIDRVHAKGLSIVGGTLFALARPDLAGWTSPYEARRLAVNTWIRTRANFDAVIDFDRLMSDGPVYEGIASLKPEFACDGDNVHPNAAGHRAMGEFVDLALFKSRRK